MSEEAPATPPPPQSDGGGGDGDAAPAFDPKPAAVDRGKNRHVPVSRTVKAQCPRGGGYTDCENVCPLRSLRSAGVVL